MIVVDTKETTMKDHSAKTEKTPLCELFRKEIDAYCDYKEWSEETDDDILEMALDEIMMDEYLHAKFLRDYMMDKGTYTLSADDPHEKKFWKIQKKLFRG